MKRSISPAIVAASVAGLGPKFHTENPHRRHRGPLFFHDPPDDEGGGTAVLEAPEFQKKVLGGVEAHGKKIKTLGDKIDEVTKNLDQTTKETKKAFEDLTKVQKENGDLNTKLLALQRTQMAVHREVRGSFGNPIQRFILDEEVRTYINAVVRAGVGLPLTEKMKASLGDDEVEAITNKKFAIRPEQRSLDESTTPGSTYLRDQLSRMIYDALPDYGIWNTLGVEPMGTKNLKLPVDTADPIALWITEANAIGDDANITGTSVTATAGKCGVLLNVSRELLQDAEYDVTTRIMKKFLRAIAKRLDYSAFVADGTNDGTNGAFTGLFNFGTAVNAATGNTTVETFDFEDVTKTVLGAAEAVLDRTARWWMHPFILIRMLSIKDSNGRPIFLNALEAPTPGGIGSILGFPVTLGHVLPTTNTAAHSVAAFGDPDAYAVGLRQDVEFDFSDHARWANDQRSFRAIARAAFKGRLATALTLLTTAAS